MKNVTGDMVLLEQLHEALGDTVTSAEELTIAMCNAGNAGKSVVWTKYLQKTLSKFTKEKISASNIPVVVLSLIFDVAETKVPANKGSQWILREGNYRRTPTVNPKYPLDNLTMEIKK